MKKLLILQLVAGLLFIIPAVAQINNKSGHHSSDSLELPAFMQLVSYISADTFDLKLAETEKNTVHHYGEEHSVYVPLARGASREPTENGSWDKSLPTIYHKEPTQGSPFLLFLYVPGLVVNDSYTVINKPDYLYNYDKMSGNLLLKRNNESPIAVNRWQVKQFCLKTDKGGLIFMRVPLINNNEFYQVIYKGSKFSSYKLYKNRFVNANQKTNGYTTDGKDYDEYEDVITYYLVDEIKGEYNIFELTRKSVKMIFGSASPAAEQFFKDHKYEDINEVFVANLADALNK